MLSLFLTIINYIALAGNSKIASEHALNGFLLGQYKPVLTKYFGKPDKVLHTEDNWEQRVYRLKSDPNAYMIFEFIPSAPDTIYCMQISGSNKTQMLPFHGLVLGDSMEKVYSQLGKPDAIKHLDDIGGDMAIYDDANFSLEFDGNSMLSSIRIVGYKGFDSESQNVPPNLSELRQSLNRRDVDEMVELLMPDVEIYLGKKLVGYQLPAIREVNDPKSIMYKTLFSATDSLTSALRNESVVPVGRLRVRDTGVVDYVFKFENGAYIDEIVYKYHAGRWRVWEASLKFLDLIELGSRVVNDGLIELDTATTESLLRLSDSKNPRAMAISSVLYFRGMENLPENQELALRLSKNSAELGDALGIAWLGQFYFLGSGGVKKDAKKAVELYKKSSEMGEPFGCALLGLAYARGDGGLAVNEAKAEKLLRRAAEAGDSTGMVNLGVMYEIGHGGLTKSRTMAISWFKKAAALGDQFALKHLNRIQSKS